MTDDVLISEAENALLVGDLEECERALDSVQVSARVLHLRGSLRIRQNRPVEAAQSLAAACDLEPENTCFRNDLGVALRLAGSFNEAVQQFLSAIESDDGFVQAWINLGMTRRAMGDLEGARAALVTASEKEPKISQIWQALGIVLRESGDLAGAVAAFERGLPLAAEADPSARCNLGRAYFESGMRDRALPLLDEACGMPPPSAVAFFNRASVRFALGLIDEAFSDLKVATGINPEEPQYWEPLVGLAIARPDFNGVALKDLAENWGRCVARLARPAIHARRARPAKLRVGWISGDFRDHSCAHFLVAPLRFRDRDRFEAFAFADFSATRQSDSVSRMLKEDFDDWLEIGGISTPNLADLIRSVEIDVLVELGGLSLGSRAQVTAWKPASVIVSWLGFPCSAGIDQYDLRVGDCFVDPPENDTHWVEKVARLPGPFLAYDPIVRFPDPDVTRIAPGNGAVSFGCFNNTSKMNLEVFRVWARILDALPGATLTIKENWMEKIHARDRILRLAQESGINASRIRMISSRLNKFDHLNSYNSIDIALDTFPYNGTTTTCEALYMGTPVVCVVGNRHAARVGYSLLTYAGLSNLVGKDLDDYVAIAIQLARDPARLQVLRQNMRVKFQASPVCDQKSFSRNFEAVLDGFWEKNAS